MKKILLLTIFLYSINLSAQIGYSKAKIYFKDGTIKEGFGKHLFMSNAKIKFKVNKKDKPIELGFMKVDKFILNDIEYDFKIIKGKSEIQFFKVKQRGKVSLYYSIKTNNGAPMGVMNAGGVGVNMSFSTSTEVYYIAKNDEDQITQLFNLFGPSKKTFKKIVPLFFGDCQDLLDKIDQKEYKKRDIVKIVNFYNYNCK
ncbi:hypothetical protein [Polaribacter sp. SA4-12]|uniref:hypothetical protein n=1 Tax=Polaribacter sp. SA4-12 TaxID=1312072 RepID=UPI000B3C7B25|nr:hypothetical protein [Polaribacter sp. SA4-12]ARV13763.1 hypothetical protein BTO07_00780 [Polaribacter sp. SA4-12]